MSVYKMFVFILVLIGFAISPTTTRNHEGIWNDFLSEIRRSDSQINATEGQRVQFFTARKLTEDAVPHERFRRQIRCGVYQWQCADGTCIPIDGECDGKIDCRDRSDETHALCRNKTCQRNWFRCTYGACVDGTAPCNRVVECADQSDELLPRCRNDTRLNKDRCLDGNSILASDYCDGVPNCPDGSDETVQACADKSCPAHLFQCAYGACVDQGADCDGRKDCVDGSDESAELCNRVLPAVENRRPVLSGQCDLPRYPEHGTYRVSNAPHATPGQALPYAQLHISCEQGYGVVGENVVYCQDGNWSTSDGLIPKCVPFCKLVPHISVHYYCKLSQPFEGRRLCKSVEPVETIVQPECNAPNYFSSEDLRYMRCQSDGQWNRIVKCKPECGRVTPDGVGLVIGGKPAMRGELPWHVAIYKKPTKLENFHNLICGGTLVSNSVVISAGHCFWQLGMPQAASKFIVATAKLFSEWNNTNDKDAQISELKSIELPEHFRGSSANFQDDLAVLILETPFDYYTYVRPVCLSFRKDLNDRQLQKGNLGKVAGFGLIAPSGQVSEILKVVDMPFVPVDECYKITPLSFTENITGDKICAGYSNGTAALCKGDSGGGLSFPDTGSGTTRFYLQGVVSTAPKGSSTCNPFTVTTFTKIRKHEDFINNFL